MTLQLHYFGDVNLYFPTLSVNQTVIQNTQTHVTSESVAINSRKYNLNNNCRLLPSVTVPLQNSKYSSVARCRRMYWSDCSGPATIQTARIVDGEDQRTLVSDREHSCIVDIAIDFESTHFSLR